MKRRRIFTTASHTSPGADSRDTLGPRGRCGTRSTEDDGTCPGPESLLRSRSRKRKRIQSAKGPGSNASRCGGPSRPRGIRAVVPGLCPHPVAVERRPVRWMKAGFSRGPNRRRRGPSWSPCCWGRKEEDQGSALLVPSGDRPGRWHPGRIGAGARWDPMRHRAEDKELLPASRSRQHVLPAPADFRRTPRSACVSCRWTTVEKRWRTGAARVASSRATRRGSLRA